MSEFNWQPIILTSPLSEKPDLRFDAAIIETPPHHDIFYFWRKLLNQLFNIEPNKSINTQLKEKMGATSRKSFIDFILNFYMAIFAYPDTEKHWRSFAVKSVDELFEKENIDAMISVWPITAHLIGKELKRKYKIPWVADFSHLWSQGYYYQYGPIRKSFDRRLEIKTLLQADALTTISPFFGEKLEKLHKRQPIYSIIHGFDPSLVNIIPATLTPKFSITYTGTLYPEKQKTSKFFAAVKELLDSTYIDRNDIEVSFYGGKYGWLTEEIKQYALSDIIYQCDVIPHSASIQKQQESQILLHLGWDDKQIQGFYSSKIFEYLAAQRPILAIGGASDEVVKDILSETKAGVYSTEVKDIKDFLERFYLEYKCNGKVTYGGNIEKINKYSHREMAKKFADILNQITGR